MDKKSITGLVLMAVILFAFSWYNASQQEKVAKQKAAIDQQNVEQAREAAAPLAEQQILATDSVPAVVDSSEMVRHIGPALFEASKGSEQLYIVENDIMKITFSNKGGKVEAVELKDYKSYNGKPLQVFAKGSSEFDLSFFIKQSYNDAQINTTNYYFTCDAPATSSVSGEEQKVSMKLHVDSTSYVEYLYTIHKDNYMIDFDINFVGMSSLFSNQSDLMLNWGNIGMQNEKGFENENNYTSIDYMFPGTDELETLGMSKESKSEEVNSKVHWIAFKQQFFSSVIIAPQSFQNASMQYDTFKPNSGNLKKFSAKLAIPFNREQATYDLQLYFGPNKYTTLKRYDIGLQHLVPMGGWLIGTVNRWLVIPVFDFLGKYISNYGLIILLLTIFIKIIISPLTYKSYLSQAKMRLLKPEMDELAAKYPKQDEAMKKQQAVMELYRRAGVSPMGGCIPMLIQFPILIAMFRFFPASIELRGEHFLWADDLSSYDSIFQLPFDIPFYGDHVSLFTLLMAVSVYISSRINYTQTASAAPQMAGMKFMMLYMMPAMLLVWFNNYSSGLSYYYLVSNIFTIGQTYAFRYAIDDKKLHEKMKENAKKPKKKSKWQTKYDDMMKVQQQQQKSKHK